MRVCEPPSLLLAATTTEGPLSTRRGNSQSRHMVNGSALSHSKHLQVGSDWLSAPGVADDTPGRHIESIRLIYAVCENVAPGILEAFDDAARPLAGYNKLRLTARAVYK
jgi:hypothetical protein